MKKYISALLILLLLFTMAPVCLLPAGAATEEFAGGSGTEADPYLIADKYHLNNVRYYPSAHFKMTKNVEFAAEDFLTGGDFYNAGHFFAPIADSFTGTFDGGGFAIKNLKINYTGDDFSSALFLSSTGIIRNLGIVGGNITGSNYYAAALVGRNSGLIENCYNTATIGEGTITDSGRNSAGLAGNNYSSGTIQNCYNAGTVIASCTDPSASYTGLTRYSYAGGITASNSGNILNCYNLGKIYAEVLFGYGAVSVCAGGIAGYDESNGGNITGCYNKGEIEGKVIESYRASSVYVSGIVAYTGVNTKIQNCYNAGNVCVSGGSDGYAGGILGMHRSNILSKNCYNIGEISSTNDVVDAYVGGVAGATAGNGIIEKCYNAGKVYGRSHNLCYTGGIAGYCPSRISYCYNNADITAETESIYDSSAYVGGIAGIVSGPYVRTLDCYNTGNVSGSAVYQAFVGGIAGYIKYSSSGSLGTDTTYVCYTTGTVSKSNPTKGTAYLGAVAGKGDELVQSSQNVFYYVPGGISACGNGVVYNCYNRSAYQMTNRSYLSYMNFDTVWYFDKSFGFEYPQLQSNPQAKPQTILLNSIPQTIEFAEGQTPDLSGLQITVIYENSLQSVVDITLSMLPELSLTTPGAQNVRVKYGNVYSEATLPFLCIAKVLTAIEIQTPPTKTTYHQGEVADWSGLTVYGVYSNQQKLLLSDYEITDFTADTPGQYQITVSKDGFGDSFAVTVSAHEYKNAYSTTEHWQQCEICGNEISKGVHHFENDCDAACDCGFTRMTEHRYDNDCDEYCNVCNAPRTVSHSYTPSFDQQHHFEKCIFCDDVINLQPHAFDQSRWLRDDRGHWRACLQSTCGATSEYADHTESEIVINQAATCTATGLGHTECTVCAMPIRHAIVLPVTDHTAGDWITVKEATTAATGLKEQRCANCNTLLATETIAKLVSNPFTDVKKSDYYYKAVLWAVENNITSGVTKTTFGPNDPCTRGQIATFLWRAAGCPTPKSSKNPFTDVKKSDYYYKAVLWAVENNITAGATKTTFAPKDACTRGQIAAFLWRAAGSPKPTTTKNPFTDVGKKAFYYKAVLWAVENGITAGTTKTTFGPNESCTRGQIVTFLYRNYN